MTDRELLACVCERSGVQTDTCTQAIDAFFTLARAALREGRRVEIPGVGIWRLTTEGSSYAIGFEELPHSHAALSADEVAALLDHFDRHDVPDLDLADIDLLQHDDVPIGMPDFNRSHDAELHTDAAPLAMPDFNRSHDAELHTDAAPLAMPDFNRSHDAELHTDAAPLAMPDPHQEPDAALGLVTRSMPLHTDPDQTDSPFPAANPRITGLAPHVGSAPITSDAHRTADMPLDADPGDHNLLTHPAPPSHDDSLPIPQIALPDSPLALGARKDAEALIDSDDRMFIADALQRAFLAERISEPVLPELDFGALRDNREDLDALPGSLDLRLREDVKDELPPLDVRLDDAPADVQPSMIPDLGRALDSMPSIDAIESLGPAAEEELDGSADIITSETFQKNRDQLFHPPAHAGGSMVRRRLGVAAATLLLLLTLAYLLYTGGTLNSILPEKWQHVAPAGSDELGMFITTTNQQSGVFNDVV